MRNYYSRIMAVMIGISLFFKPLAANKADLNQSLDPEIRIEVNASVVRLPFSMETDELSIFLAGVKAGETYTLFLSKADPSQHGKVIFQASNHYNLLRENVIQFTASDDSFKIKIFKKETSKRSRHALQLNLSIACETCASTESSRSLMGILTDQNYNPEQLVRDVFIGGDCFDVETASIVYNGNPLAAGYFSNGAGAIDIEEGIILSTGNIANSAGPNDVYNSGNSFLGFNSDPDLSNMVNSIGVYDVAVLEFDFTPTADVISFEFVFASEEYCEYVNSSFNDVFGFFVSGPGFNGPYTNNAENIAIVPGTNDDIAINSVNHLQNSGFYVNNIPAWQHAQMPSYLECDDHPTGDGLAIEEIEYDGFTTVMTATMNVQACETYHIKLAIADATDGYYDSAVFLKANSFNSGGMAIVSAEVPGNTTPANIAYEDCHDGFFVFNRPNEALNDSMVVYFSLSGTGTATPGLDFEVLPDSIVIPAGDSVYYLPVNVFSDALTEGTESIILELDAPCSCSMAFTEMWIADVAELTVELEDFTICEPEEMALIPAVNGGLGDYTYNWNTGDSTAAILVNPDSTSTYTLIVSDECGNTVETFSTVEIIGVPTASISGYEQVCAENPSAELTIEFSGSGPWDFVYTHNGNPQAIISGITANPYVLTVQQTGVYHLQSVVQEGCYGAVQGAASVVSMTFSISAVETAVSCPGESDGAIDLTVNGGTAPYAYQWDNGGGIVEDPVNLSEGMYNLTLTDANGCTAEFSTEIVLDANIPEAFAGNDQQLSCAISEVTLSGTGSAGSEMNYEWTTNDGNIVSGANTLSPVVDQNGTYHLYVTNSTTNCTATDKTEVFLDTLAPVPNIEVIGSAELDCTNSSTILDANGSQPVGALSYQWSTLNGNIVGSAILPAIEVDAGGIYQLFITNTENGCTASADYTLLANIDLPEIYFATPGILTCVDSLIEIDAGNSSTGPEFEYLWTTTNGNLLYGETTLLPAVDQPGIYFLTIYNTSNNCQVTSQVEVGQDVEIPLADAGLSIDLDCNSSVVTLDGSQSSIGVAYSYGWSTSNGSILQGETTLYPSVNMAGDYLLTVVNNQNGCEASDLVSVFENSNPPEAAEIEVVPPPCAGDPGSIIIHGVSGGESPFLYSIDGGENYYQEAIFTDLNSGSFELIIQDAQGCRYEDTLSIPSTPEMTVFVEPEITLELGESFEINAQVNIPDYLIDSVLWSPAEFLSCTDCLNPVATPFVSTLYTILVISDNACKASGEIFIKIDPVRKVFIPNVFSPNGDGNNDVFYIFGNEKSIVRINRLEIFNRWGAKLFAVRDISPNDPSVGWDGTFKGEVLNPLVVVYLAEIEFVDGKKVVYSGDLTVVD